MQSRFISLREVFLASVAVGAGVLAVSLVAAPARQRKMSSSCLSNLMQIGLAMAQYSQDNDNTLPRPWFGHDEGPSDAKHNSKWMDAVFPYLRRESLFLCPADSQSKPYHFRQGDSYGSYLFNDAYFAPGDKFTPPGGQRLERIADANTALIMCGGSGFRFGWPDVKSQPPLEEDHVGDIQFFHTSYPMTLWIAGNVVGYRPAQILGARDINGQRVYTGLTIEAD